MAEGNTHASLALYPNRRVHETRVALSEDTADPQFLHTALCQLGLPRNPTKSSTFERTSGRASLLVQAGQFFDGMKWVPQPLPSGTRPRLVLINVCSEAVRTRSPDVDVGGSVREFLRRLNIDTGGKDMAQFRKQMLALSSCHMTLAMATAHGTTQVDAKPIDRFQAWLTQEDGQQALWPGQIRLTDKFFESLVEHAVPLEPEAIGKLQNSALNLDVYSWMAHRLCRVSDPNGVLVSWVALKEQFGQEYAGINNFRRKFLGALEKATSVYKDARIEVVTDGLKLLPSAPPVKRTTVRVVARVPGEAGAKATALPSPERHGVQDDGASQGRAQPIQLSVEALEAVCAVAPGYDKYFLERKFLDWVAQLKEPLKLPPDQAFLRWAPKFTKGKRP